MTVLSESHWYQEILQKGQREDRLSSIELSLEVKFGNEGLNLMPKILEISDLETLKTIQRSILTVKSLEELRLVMGNL